MEPLRHLANQILGLLVQHYKDQGPPGSMETAELSTRLQASREDTVKALAILWNEYYVEVGESYEWAKPSEKGISSVDKA
jgi:hypothetical protein